MKVIFPQAANENLTFDQGQPWSKRGIREHKKGAKKKEEQREGAGKKKESPYLAKRRQKRLLRRLVLPIKSIYRIKQRAFSSRSSGRLLTSFCLLMPAHYEFFLTTYDNHRKFVSQSSVLFRKVL